MNKEELTKLIADIQKKMQRAAADLNFEAAAEYRDQMLQLKTMPVSYTHLAMLVNTVPAPVVTRVIIKELPRDAYILDIASKPGGTDFACAKEFGIRADLVLGIPGKYAPKESAYILERSMERFAAKQKSIDR